MTKHFNQNNILYDLQHGFREKRSCETQLIVEDLARNMTSGKQTDLKLLDFSKAFDKINRLKLLYKLQVHGVQGKTLGWIESFLVGRTQCVVLDGDASSELSVSSGVPQGLFWVPYYFCFTSMTCPTISILRFVSLRTIPRCTWHVKDKKTQPPFKMS